MFPAIITLEELGFKQDFGGVELDNCNDVKKRSTMMNLKDVCCGLYEEEAIVGVKA